MHKDRKKEDKEKEEIERKATSFFRFCQSFSVLSEEKTPMKEEVERNTIWQSWRICLAPTAASSWLSLISKLITWTGFPISSPLFAISVNPDHTSTSQAHPLTILLFSAPPPLIAQGKEKERRGKRRMTNLHKLDQSTVPRSTQSHQRCPWSPWTSLVQAWSSCSYRACLTVHCACTCRTKKKRRRRCWKGHEKLHF